MEGKRNDAAFELTAEFKTVSEETAINLNYQIVNAPLYTLLSRFRSRI